MALAAMAVALGGGVALRPRADRRLGRRGRLGRAEPRGEWVGRRAARVGRGARWGGAAVSTSEREPGDERGGNEGNRRASSHFPRSVQEIGGIVSFPRRSQARRRSPDSGSRHPAAHPRNDAGETSVFGTRGAPMLRFHDAWSPDEMLVTPDDDPWPVVTTGHQRCTLRSRWSPGYALRVRVGAVSWIP